MPQNQEPTKQKKKPSFGRILLVCLCLAVLAFCLYKLLPKAEEYHESAKTYKKIRKEAVITPSPEPIDAVSAQPEPKPVIDWEQFKGMDVVAWLMLDDISYPVLQGKDNSEYLHALPDHTYNYGGSIILDSVNSKYFTDRNSIIYGHNMADGSMFGKFRSRYGDAQYKDHTFCLYLPDGTKHTYTFFSVLTTEMGSSVYTYEFGNDNSFLDWQNMLKRSARYENSPQPDKNAKFVSLSTCNGMAGTTHRLVVVGKETTVETVQKPASWYVVPPKKDNEEDVSNAGTSTSADSTSAENTDSTATQSTDGTEASAE